MPNWNQVLAELQSEIAKNNNNPLDAVRQRYLGKLHDFTQRNVICYYSGWLQKPGLSITAVDDNDKNGLMATVHGLDRQKGLDLILHTPGGNIAATESLVNYLRKIFGPDIRAIIPQIAMSAGTMLACACNEIWMGKQSNIGPFDPQFDGIPAHGVIDEFERALAEVKKDPGSTPLWQVVVGQYHPTFLGECKNAIDMASEMVNGWLTSGMFKDDPEATKKAAHIVACLNNHKDTKAHARHIHMEEAEKIGLKVQPLEKDQEFQDLVLTVHHAYMHTLANTKVAKMIENHNGITMAMFVP